MTLPNLITTIRIILAPIFIIYLISEQFLSALIVFLICVVSDGLDGLFARIFNQKSRLGTYLDPLADKILLVATFITLGVRRYLPPWLTVLVIARDVMILLGIFFLFIHAKEPKIRPSIISKINTCLQFVTVLSVLAKDYLSFPSIFYLTVYYLTALFTISSGLHYMHFWFKTMGDGIDSQNDIS